VEEEGVDFDKATINGDGGVSKELE